MPSARSSQPTACAHQRHLRRRAGAERGTAAAAAAPVTGPAGEELETFLVNFVVEQTGYPPEVVELDADLEADLGIDSIKKAQLFGELREYLRRHAERRISRSTIFPRSATCSITCKARRLPLPARQASPRSRRARPTAAPSSRSRADGGSGDDNGVPAVLCLAGSPRADGH